MLSKYIKNHKYPHNFNENGLEPTKNRMGGMHTLSEYSALFIELSSTARLPVIDIGCAYGVATIPALEKGAKVIAIDLERQHLDILRERTPPSLTRNLITIHAKFPEEISLPNNSVSAVLMSRIFSFLTPQELTIGMEKIFSWLEPGGTVFAINHTPYIELFEYYLKEFDHKKKNGDLWPGMIDDLTTHPKYEFYQMPAWINLMDKHIFKRLFTTAGFKIEKLEYFSSAEIIPQHGAQYDDRELISCIAVKGK